MNRIIFPLGLILLAGCGPSPSGPRLWLAPKVDELHVQLVPVEPPNPF
jgi:hypothetical protein